jgi:hypothetical protein
MISIKKYFLYLQKIIWSHGRVARQRSAKPSTAVRIRLRPFLFHILLLFFKITFINIYFFKFA